MKRISILSLLTMCFVATFAQMRTITGIVTDETSKNEGLVGAMIAIKDGKSTKGTVTDSEGKFLLSLSADIKVMTISSMGYETKKVTLEPGVSHYTITLHPVNQNLDEFVVTGYQQIDRRKLTAAVTTVKISDETVGAVKNIDQALAGQVAGLSSVTSSGAPGSPVKIRIRGTASINGVQEPLWVLDGIPLEGNEIPAIENLNDIDEIYQTSIAGINPSDIENITVLKDAAATAIYGARAANGVIVITTKKGKEGRSIVNVSSKLTYSPTMDIDRLNLLNSDEKVNLELDLLGSDYTYRQSKGGVANILNELGEIDAYKTGGWAALSPEAQQRINRLRVINTDWNDILFRDVFNQEHNVSVSGGSDRAHYYASVGYYNEQGNVKGVENERYNITLKGDYKINRYLTVDASVFANQRTQESYMTDAAGFTNPVYYSRMANPYFEPFDSNGNYIYDKNVQGRESEVPDFNIFEERANTLKERTDRSIMALFGARFDITSHLKLTTQFGIQHDNYTLTRYAGHDSYAMRKIKEYGTFVIDGERKSIFPDGGMNKVTESHTDQWTLKAMLEWNRRIFDVHDLELMGGTEIRHTETGATTSTVYGYDKRTLTTQPVLFPSQSIAESYPLYQEIQTENAYASWFATGSYTYHYRYTLGASVRFDGSDVFGVAKKYRYLPLYSFSTMWRAKEEAFLQKVRWIDELSLRASYGLQGNIDKNTSPYLIGQFDKVTVLPGNIEDIIATETAPNPNLKWEKTRNVNVGLNMEFFHNRLRVNVDYYYRRGTDLISSRQLPLETGFSSTTINWASMENKGWEFAVSTTNIKTRNFKWTTMLNLGFNTNKILDESVAENSTNPSREGYPIGAIFAYKTAGIDKDGYPLFVGKDGSILTAKEFFNLNRFGASGLSAEEQRNLYTYMGTSEPKCSGGFINTFEWGNWQLNLNFVFNLGMKVRVQPSYSPVYYDRGLNTNKDILNRWTAANPYSSLPGLMTNNVGRSDEYTHYEEYNTYSMLDIWVRKQNYCRLQSVRIGYRIPSKLLAPLGITSASLSFEGRNLLVIASDYENYLDPETMGNPFAQPIPKSYIFGLNVTF
ncbi:MAG: SusC/RagA family TonB-linked outer membrane protein [Bacteroidales bacterium]|nr:SusC/RagA family TonB-linked outer membrane protein [Bacteroidales bacterium]